SDFCITQNALQKIPKNPPRRLERIGKQASAAVVVVVRAAAAIGQHLPGLLNFTEAGSRIRGGGSVRVMLRGLLSISRLDDIGTGVRHHTKQRVVIPHETSRLAHTADTGSVGQKENGPGP